LVREKKKKFYPQIQGVTNLSPLKESRPRDSGLASKELRVLGHQAIFTLPGCFFLRMVIPSNFAHSDGLPSGDSVCNLKDLHWLLNIGQVLLTDCSDDSDTDAEKTAFGTADAAEVDAGSA
jgi:hypothetical protein